MIFFLLKRHQEGPPLKIAYFIKNHLLPFVFVYHPYNITIPCIRSDVSRRRTCLRPCACASARPPSAAVRRLPEAPGVQFPAVHRTSPQFTTVHRASPQLPGTLLSTCRERDATGRVNTSRKRKFHARCCVCLHIELRNIAEGCA